MVKTTTYYVQDRDGIINSLCDRYGAQFEAISRSNKLAILSGLTAKLYLSTPEMLDLADDQPTALADAMDVFDYGHTLDTQDEDGIYEALEQIDLLNEDDAIALCEALIAQIKSGRYAESAS